MRAWWRPSLSQVLTHSSDSPRRKSRQALDGGQSTSPARRLSRISARASGSRALNIASASARELTPMGANAGAHAYSHMSGPQTLEVECDLSDYFHVCGLLPLCGSHSHADRGCLVGPSLASAARLASPGVAASASVTAGRQARAHPSMHARTHTCPEPFHQIRASRAPRMQCVLLLQQRFSPSC